MGTENVLGVIGVVYFVMFFVGLLNRKYSVYRNDNTGEWRAKRQNMSGAMVFWPMLANLWHGAWMTLVVGAIVIFGYVMYSNVTYGSIENNPSTGLQPQSSSHNPNLSPIPLQSHSNHE